MSQISVDVRLRPVRCAFLVRPNSSQSVLGALRVNTCLWGGQFNPLIPVFRRVPRWWDRHGHAWQTAEQILNNYLDFFEPDYVVETEPGLAQGLGFAKERIIQLSDMLIRNHEHHRTAQTLDVIGLYQDLYQKVFQFETRHSHSIVHVRPKQRRFTAFCASLFGGFPEEPELDYFGNSFLDAFNPEDVTLDGPTPSGRR